MWKTTFLIPVTLLFALTQAEGKPENRGNDISGIFPDTIRPPSLVSCPDYPGPGYHIVQPGQTLYAISRAYEIPIQSLIHWNNISDPDKIEVCQKIWLGKPGDYSAAPVTYSPKGQTARSITSFPVAKRQDVYWGNASGPPQTTSTAKSKGIHPGANVTPASYESPAYTQATTANIYGYSPMSLPSDCAEKSGPGYHIVQSGETPASIAKIYGVTEEDLKRVNNISAAANLKKCMRLNLPAFLYGKYESKKAGIYEIPPVAPVASFSLHAPDAPDPLKPKPYLVQHPESLVSFAARTKTNPQVLAALNQIRIDAQLRPGQSLILPSNRNP